MYNYLYGPDMWPCSIGDEEMEALWVHILKYKPSDVIAEIPEFEHDMTGTTSFLHWVVRCSDEYDLAEYICSLSYTMDWKDDECKKENYIVKIEGKYYDWYDRSEEGEVKSLADFKEKFREKNYLQQNAAAIVVNGNQTPLYMAIHKRSNIETIKLLIREYPAGLAVKNNVYSSRETPLEKAETSKYSVPPPEVIQLLRDCTEAYEQNNVCRVCQLCDGVLLYRIHLRSTFLCCLKHMNAPRTQRRNKRAKAVELVKGLIRD
ncbi:hypothetical protein TL16_g10487 [Triparma laevis f. inornata]|uniref:Ankyrin repeat protein n=2 Tax=Triparma laevis TaxID=1534972 RepID=A0A9W7FQ93_9STRA|nr:hypothetical protein TL16_g10487 [Triparma laevis f. inornata]GMI16347.1 hypothetical protein TrLO_g11863 [Triparma laevis f. longispina]